MTGFAAGSQALQYLWKLCSHPLLVLDRSVPQHAAAALAETGAAPEAWDTPGSPLRLLRHAPKLLALRQLLQVRLVGIILLQPFLMIGRPLLLDCNGSRNDSCGAKSSSCGTVQ